jgi:prepilin peptidase CpaA
MILIYACSVLGALGCLLWACKTDLLSMTIPNRIPLLLAALFIPAYFCGASEGFLHWKAHLAAVGLMFVVTFIMFALKIWGAGDSKLATALSLWIGLKGLVTFLSVMALSGLGLVAISLVIRKIKFKPGIFPEQSWIRRLQAGEKNLPYGIAIVAGGVAAFIERGYFDFLSPLLHGG